MCLDTLHDENNDCLTHTKMYWYWADLEAISPTSLKRELVRGMVVESDWELEHEENQGVGGISYPIQPTILSTWSQVKQQEYSEQEMFLPLVGDEQANVSPTEWCTDGNFDAMRRKS